MLENVNRYDEIEETLFQYDEDIEGAIDQFEEETESGVGQVKKFINEKLGIDVRVKWWLDGNIYVNVKDVAKGLGFIREECMRKSTAKFGCTKHQPESIRWDRINQYLMEEGYPHPVNSYSYIPEQYFYLLAMRTNKRNEAAKKFRNWLAFDVIPNIRKCGMYVDPNHGAIRELTKIIRKNFTKSIARLIRYSYEKKIERNMSWLYSWLTVKTQIDCCGIPKGGRDKIDTENLIKLIVIESIMTDVITSGIEWDLSPWAIIKEIIRRLDEISKDTVIFEYDDATGEITSKVERNIEKIDVRHYGKNIKKIWDQYKK